MNELPNSNAMITRTTRTIRNAFMMPASVESGTGFAGSMPLLLGNLFVYSGNYHTQRVYVLAVGSHDVVGVSVAIAEFVCGGEGGGFRAGERGDARENFLGCSGRLFLKRDQRVSQQGERAGGRFCRGGAQFAFLLAGEQKSLPQP